MIAASSLLKISAQTFLNLKNVFSAEADISISNPRSISSF
jgi:hypothetical protein